MKKIIFAVFLFLSTSLLIPKTASAACAITVTPPSIPLNYNGKVEIKSDCFNQKLSYVILAYPKQFGALAEATKVQGKVFSRYYLAPRMDNSPTLDPASQILTAKLNLTEKLSETLLSETKDIVNRASLGVLITEHPALGKDYPNQDWNITVCVNDGKPYECEDTTKNSLLVGIGTIFVSESALPPPLPTPTPEQDQPLISRESSQQCNYQLGDDVKLLIQNIQPSTQYGWNWDGLSATNSFFTSVNKNRLNSPEDKTLSLNLNISYSSEIKNSLKNATDNKGHLLCVDLANRVSEGTIRFGSNCIRLYFTASKPDNLFCSEANSPQSAPATPTPSSPLPPCSQWAYSDGTPISTGTDPLLIQDKQCISVPTAVGPINTEPQKFVQSIFTIVLGIAGGIALILIIISGYKFMTSQGNPEAINNARQQLIGTVVGLLFIIFSFVILQVIGVDILRIPGFQP